MRAIEIKHQWMSHPTPEISALRTTLGEEVQEEKLDAGGDRAEADHPSPAAGDVREAGVDAWNVSASCERVIGTKEGRMAGKSKGRRGASRRQVGWPLLPPLPRTYGLRVTG